MPRFVLLYHDCPSDYERPPHWDLMLQSGEVLRTWALVELPGAWQFERSSAVTVPDAVEAEELGDHRLAYLDYEGPVSGERGSVRRVDTGTYETIVYASDRWEITLNGRLLCGTMDLQRATESDD
jgi:DNA polymerase Ligase (LigD)